jgi:NADH dehydrogenase [ubiquinone] 1 alpha subcomplex assembly factor 7
LLTYLIETSATPLPLLAQRAFLTRMPLEQRLARLIQHAQTEERKHAISEGVQRLVDPIGMGSQYKFLGVVGRASDAETQKVDGVFPFGLDLEESP